jgi:hypothetical protein
MKRTSFKLINLFLIMALALALCSCAALQSPIGAAATFNGLKNVAAGNPGTFIMQANNMVMLAWPRGGEYAFAMFCDGACPAMKLTATMIGTLNFSETVKYLENVGWRYIQPSDLPAWIASALAASTVEAMTSAIKTLPSIFIVPVISVTPAWIAPEVQS